MISGEEIRARRKHLGFSQGGFAERLGVSRSAVYEWERGKYFPEGENLKNLSEVLGLSIAYIVGETDDPGESITSAEASIFAKEHLLKGSEDGAVKIPMVSKILSASPKENSMHAAEVDWKLSGGSHTLPLETLTKHIREGASQFFAMDTLGDSMFPRICDGERIIFARDAVIENGDFVLLTWGGKLLVRGIIFEKDERIILRAVHKDYEDIHVPPRDSRLCVIGKVVKVIPLPREAGGLWS